MAKKKRVAAPKDKPKQFVLKMNRRQAGVITAALDLYSRIGMGQISEVENILRLDRHVKPDYSHDAVRNALDFVKREIFGLDGNGNLGIHNETVPKNYRVAWDLQQVIRHFLSWDANPEGGSGVSFHEPMKSSDEELATMTAVVEQHTIDDRWEGQ